MAIKNLAQVQKHLFICNGNSCKRLGAEESTALIRSTIKEMSYFDDNHTTKTLCNGRCDDAPVVICMPEGKWFKEITPDYAVQFAKSLLTDTAIAEEHQLYVYGEETINSESIVRG